MWGKVGRVVGSTIGDTESQNPEGKQKRTKAMIKWCAVTGVLVYSELKIVSDR